MNHFPVRNRYEQFTIAVDLDGCLAPFAQGEKLDFPNFELVAMLRRLAHRYNVVVFSARPAAHHHIVRQWLDEWNVPISQICLGSKPAADVFVDDRGLLPPLEVLEAYIERLAHGCDLEALTFGADQGPFSAQMAACWENPDYTPDPARSERFLVDVPLSGGIDSTTAWLMALTAGLPTHATYVDTGAGYSQDEWDVVKAITADIDTDVDYIHRPVRFQQWQHVDRARNAVIVYTIADKYQATDQWGEIWFGNIAEWAETPIYGGDKSHRWLLTMQQLLTVEGYDVRLASPLGSMTKADAVAWCVRNGWTDVIVRTRSCYTPGMTSCGQCRSCFRRWIALEANDLNGHPDAWPGTTLNFTAQARDLHAHAVGEGVEWSLRRVRPALRLTERWL